MSFYTLHAVVSAFSYWVNGTGLIQSAARKASSGHSLVAYAETLFVVSLVTTGLAKIVPSHCNVLVSTMMRSVGNGIQLLFT
ncbi:MAG: hypothetical protein U0003_00925 [Vampirovibrionales bacterium]